MLRTRKLSFEELVAKNKQELLNDKNAMNKLEEQLEKKHLQSVIKKKQSI
ncbi:FbpB family small basic protein [Aquibacillus salsiterrae]|uniref:FbpB family small basic protein n=1 Tax=Aquibacillus salsiterrae TaxID=2950439 RepID=A0A9X3WGE6_9BACI|nr:FbpB family small basic protein [Aquibacillus salsiterrae]MDC3416551.1 FbpB family small basic protein [Aquibacillus salsiterrae]